MLELINKKNEEREKNKCRRRIWNGEGGVQERLYEVGDIGPLLLLESVCSLGHFKLLNILKGTNMYFLYSSKIKFSSQ